MMNRKAAHDDIELAVLERQPRLDVALLEADVGDSALARIRSASLSGASVRSMPTTSRQTAANAIATYPGPVATSSTRASARRRDHLDQLV